MAYLIGLVTQDEAKELERRGWELEEPPPQFGAEMDLENKDVRYIQVWVDANLFEIMDGDDWEKG